MKIEFKNKDLELVETDQAIKTKLPLHVINSCRKKLCFMRAAPDEITIKNWKSLHCEKLKGDKDGQVSIRLNDQWRMLLRFDKNNNPPKIIVLSIEDYH